MNENVLVTGAGGFIGSHLCERLIEKGYKVTAFLKYNSKNHYGWLENSKHKKNIEFVSGDIRDRDILKIAIKNKTIVFHLAALIGIPYSYHSPDAYAETNIKGTLNILQVSKEYNVEKIVHTSTSEIYGTAQYVPINEKHPVNPQSPYAATKASADFLALSFYKSFNTPVTVLRPFNTYGPRQSSRAIIPTIITQILAGNKKIKLGSLSPTRDLTFVKDTADAFINAAESKQSIGKIINAGSNFEISIKDLCLTISKLLSKNIEIVTDQIRKRPLRSEVERLWADNSLAKQILNWQPTYSLEKGLKETIDWMKKNINQYKPDIYNI